MIKTPFKPVRVFIYKWLFPIFMGLLLLISGIIAFAIKEIESGAVLFLLSAVVFIIHLCAFPHSFIFDSEKIKAVYLFRTKAVKYKDISSCEREESGIKSYPWGAYYVLFSTRPEYVELNIPSTKEIDLIIKERVNFCK